MMIPEIDGQVFLSAEAGDSMPVMKLSPGCGDFMSLHTISEHV